MRHATCRLLAASFTAILATLSAADLEAQTLSQQAVAAAAVPEVAREAPPAPRAVSPSVRDIVFDAAGDFRNIATWQNLAILTGGGIGASLANTADPAVSRTMFQSSSLDTALQAGETLGGARTQLAAAVATYAFGRVASQSRIASLGADLIRAQIVTQSMTAAIKLSVGRTRPDGTEYSFPSGHSSVTFATATVLHQNFGWKVGAPAYGLATYVAASRVQDKRHFLSDVAFGAAIGIVGGRAVTVGRGDAKFAVSPAAAPGGAAVRFAWTPDR
jgi:membrane-associated phospholipid phosphatase